jgi:hypothetical protein
MKDIILDTVPAVDITSPYSNITIEDCTFRNISVGNYNSLIKLKEADVFKIRNISYNTIYDDSEMSFDNFMISIMNINLKNTHELLITNQIIQNSNIGFINIINIIDTYISQKHLTILNITYQNSHFLYK